MSTSIYGKSENFLFLKKLISTLTRYQNMKYFLLLFLFLLTYAVSAQKNKIPDGTWVSDSACRTYIDDTLLCDDCCETNILPFIFTFCDGSLYTESANSHGYYIKNFKMSRNKLKIKEPVYFCDGEMHPDWYWFPDEFTYEFSNDSTFTLINKQGSCKSIISAHRAPLRTYQSVEELGKIHQDKIDSATTNELILVKSDSTNKEIVLNTKGRIELYTDSFSTCGYVLSVNYFIEKVSSVKDKTFLYIYPSGIEKSRDYCNGYYGIMKKTISPYKFGNDFIPVNKFDVKYIVYFKPGEFATYNTLNTVGWLSFCTALFIAPMASLKFSDFGFNSKRYLTIAGTSLLTMTVSFSLKKLFNGKQYLLGSKYGENGWKFK